VWSRRPATIISTDAQDGWPVDGQWIGGLGEKKEALRLSLWGLMMAPFRDTLETA
jgi:hypothetical protein